MLVSLSWVSAKYFEDAISTDLSSSEEVATVPEHGHLIIDLNMTATREG